MAANSRETFVKLVIIESPYKGDVPRNLRYLRSCIRDCLSHGESPYASHRMLTDALDDGSPAERALGIEAGLAWRRALWLEEVDYGELLRGGTSSLVREDIRRVLPVFYIDLGWSTGMLKAQGLYDDEQTPYEARYLASNDPFFKEVAPDVHEQIRKYAEMICLCGHARSAHAHAYPPDALKKGKPASLEAQGWTRLSVPCCRCTCDHFTSEIERAIDATWTPSSPTIRPSQPTLEGEVPK